MFEKNRTVGGIETATAQTPLIAAICPASAADIDPDSNPVVACDNIRTPTVIAILLIGPPKSKQIIAPIKAAATNSKFHLIKTPMNRFNPTDIAYSGMYPMNAMKNHGTNVNRIGIINNGTIAWNGADSTLSV